MEEAKRLKLFRNPWPEKKFYLRSRNPDNPNENFVLMPGATIQALDAAEEKLLASMSLIDVEKETPAMASATEALEKQLAEERARNVALKAENDALGQEVEKSKRRLDARPTGKR